MIPAQRRERIHEFLLLHKIATNATLSELLDVSEATIRRDLELLEADGILERTHGGAILRTGSFAEPEYVTRAQRYTNEKRLIGAYAAGEIEDGDIVFINSGTTTTHLIRSIRPDVDAIVITNNLQAPLEMGNINFELILTGGSFQPKSNSVAGRFSIENLRHVYATKAFIGVDGINIKYGWTVPSNAEAEVIRLMLERTIGPTTVVADHSKWGNISNFEIAKIDQIHKLITDDGLSMQARSSLSARSIEVKVANGSQDSGSTGGGQVREMPFQIDI